MKIVHIDHRKAKLEDAGRKIIVRVNGHRKATIPMRLLERLVITSTADISSSLLLKLNEQGAGILVLPSRYRSGRPLHIIRARTDIPLIHAQLLAAASPARALPLATGFIVTKLRGHRLLIDELARMRMRQQRQLQRASARLASAIEALKTPMADKNRLRGIEGAASAQFFAAWGKCLPSSLNFSTRNRRPPLDPVNVCLSIGYTLAHHEALIAACAIGLDPQIGFLHDPLANRDSLACDIVETARPLIDRWVYELFMNGGLRPDHFSTTASSCLASKAGRKRIYENYFEQAATGITAICIHHAGLIRAGLVSANNLPDMDATPQQVNINDRH
jgi:CRISPR-associated protein Cas1